MPDYNELKRLAEAATPQEFDTAEEKSGNGYIECPHCGGSGEVEIEADYCNYDGAAIGVQFYGIGHEFGAAEAYYRAANPAAVLTLIADLERNQRMLLAACMDMGAIGNALGADMNADGDELLGMVVELKAERDRLREDRDGLLEAGAHLL
ncbi:hypothetical protein IQK56_07160 [Pseudomonas sp. MAFF 301449]|uniref:Uncharacterized protein n=1 Tax=Pseudomonas cyclaminis TaxID=2781239 RepID=A0ABR9SPA0_9PSED|nr:hypothetical protein [Pseudomonas cyclaminis]MBE8590725.1 hypothetical protein [Pseudomonas cyclaminis]MBE8602040.1 hypothetical protein [Pseudomonas cyclaminis]